MTLTSVPPCGAKQHLDIHVITGYHQRSSDDRHSPQTAVTMPVASLAPGNISAKHIISDSLGLFPESRVFSKFVLAQLESHLHLILIIITITIAVIMFVTMLLLVVVAIRRSVCKQRLCAWSYVIGSERLAPLVSHSAPHNRLHATCLLCSDHRRQIRVF